MTRKTSWTKEEFDTLRTRTSLSLRRWYKDEEKALTASRELGARQMVESLRPLIARGMTMGLDASRIATKLQENGIEIKPSLLRSIMRETGPRREDSPKHRDPGSGRKPEPKAHRGEASASPPDEPPARPA